LKIIEIFDKINAYVTKSTENSMSDIEQFSCMQIMNSSVRDMNFEKKGCDQIPGDN
jgi:hypothetical protein